MANGKVRSESHLIDQEAIGLVKRKLPREWVTRELTPDYGLDLDVELFEKEDNRIVTLGERLYIQVKGTTKATYTDVSIKTGRSELTKRCISFSLDTDLLKLVERVGDSLPILLSVVNLNTEEAFVVSLNDYVNFVLCDDIKWREQKTKVIKIPCENKIEMVKLLRWYAIRPKLNSFFAEAAVLRIDAEYALWPESYIDTVKRFALKYIGSDVWNCKRFGFGFLDEVYNLIKDIANGKDCCEADNMFRSFNPEDLISNGKYDNMPITIARQVFTCGCLISELGSANSIFSSCMRQLFSITEFEAIVSQ